MQSVAHRLTKNFGALVFLGAIVLQTLLLSRFAASQHLVPNGGDMRFYLDWGMRIAEGQWTDHQAFYGLPGYAYWLGALLMVTSSDPVSTSLIAGAVQTIAFAAIAWLIYEFTSNAIRSSCDNGRKGVRPEASCDVGVDEDRVPPSAAPMGILAAAAWVFFTAAQAYSVILMPTVGAVLAYWFGVRIVSRVSWETPRAVWLGFGLLIGFTTLFVATVFFLLPLACFAIFRGISQEKGPCKAFHGAAAVILLLAGVLLGTSPASLHNFFVARDPVLLSAHSGINMWIGNNPVANGYPRIPSGLRSEQEGLLEDSLRIPPRLTGRPMSRSEISEFWNAKATAWIHANPDAWLSLVRRKLANFWNAFRYDDINVLHLLSADGVSFGYSSFGVISTFGLAGLSYCGLQIARSRWVVAGVLLHMLALVPVFVTERYRLMAVPGLIVCGSLMVWMLWRNVAEWRLLHLASQITILGASLAFVTIPRVDPGPLSLKHFSYGIHKLAIADAAASEDNHSLREEALNRSRLELEIAYRYTPGNTEVNLALGNLHKTTGDLARAKIYYSRVLRLDPDHSSALTNLGLVALELRKWDIAIRVLHRALSSSPQSTKLYYILAKAYEGRGDLISARQNIDTALAISPNQPLLLEFRRELEASSPIHYPADGNEQSQSR